ncbi:MAG: ATP-binding protein [Mariniphaga sp.]
MRSLIFCLFIVLVSTSASAQTLVLTDSVTTNDVSKFLHYLPNQDSNFTIERISDPSIHWLSIKDGDTPNLGLQKDAYWFMFNLQNNSIRKDWLMHVDYSTLDLVNAYISDSLGVLANLGSQGVLIKNLHKQRMPVFELDLKKGELVHVYLKVKTSSFLILPVKVSTLMAFSETENTQRDLYLPAWGILIAALLFNLVLLVTSREKAFLFLLLSIASEICFIGVISGMFYEYNLFDPPIILQKLRFVLLGLVYGFHVLFTFYYLNLKNHKTIRWIELGLATYFFVYSSLAWTAVLSPGIRDQLMITTNLLFFFVQVSLAFYLSLRRVPMARYYLISFFPVLLAMLLYIAIFKSWIEVDLFFSNSGLYASALFTVLLTSGLTEKMIKVKHETARADQLEIDKIDLEAEIERRKKAEEKLQESEIRFHGLFELSPLPVLLTEFESGKIVDFNLSLCNFTGLLKEAIIGRTTYELGLMENNKKEELLGHNSQNGHVLDYESVIFANGKPRTVHLFMSLLNIGVEKFMITLFSDITTEKEVQVRLNELNLTKDKLISVIAHDLVNPFHALILYSKELKVYTAGNERAALYNSNLLLTAQNTYNLLQNLLTWSRTQTRQISFNPQQVNLGDLISEAVEYARMIAQAKQIEIINEANIDVQIEADVQMINVVLRKLISNSIKFSFNQGLVKVKMDVNENHVNILIIDQGTGIEQHEVKKLFNLFETSQRPGTSGEAGTGLGLVICNEFVNYHCGIIKIKSEPGKGSTFIVVLPKKQL